jgi:hypothetical protein
LIGNTLRSTQAGAAVLADAKPDLVSKAAELMGMIHWLPKFRRIGKTETRQIARATCMRADAFKQR